MRKHDFRRKFAIQWEKGIIKLLLVLLALVVVVILTVLFFPTEEMKSVDNLFARAALLFKSEVSVSVYVSALVSSVVVVVVSIFRNRSEEYIKLNDDRDGLVHKYYRHYKYKKMAKTKTAIIFLKQIIAMKYAMTIMEKIIKLLLI